MSAPTADPERPGPGIRTRDLLRGAVPALLVGIVAALVLRGVDGAAEALEHLMWGALPAALGTSGDSWWWILGTLSLTGLAVGLIVQFAPGHGGPDTATIEFLAPRQPLRHLPGIAAVLLLGLAGGVSLGPEGPIIAITTAITTAVLGQLVPGLPARSVVMITASGTIGAMFGTPVAAALLLTGMLAAAGVGGTLWDRLFLPLTAAATGAMTALLLGGPTLTLTLPPYTPQALDLLTGTLVALVAAGLAALAVVIFPRVHALFRRLGHPVLYITAGGVILGVLGVVGGPITLFKGLHQMAELLGERRELSVSTLVVIILVKVAALVIAATAGFRGGRIFPALFIGVAIGLLASVLMPVIPVGLAIAAGVLGFVLVVSRDGWLALFLAVAVSGDIATLPVLCVIVLPAWLLARGVPEMIVPLGPDSEGATR